MGMTNSTDDSDWSSQSVTCEGISLSELHTLISKQSGLELVVAAAANIFKSHDIIFTTAITVRKKSSTTNTAVNNGPSSCEMLPLLQEQGASSSRARGLR